MATQPRLANKQYNTPIGLYSQQNVQEVLQREQQILANGAIGIDFTNPAVGKPANLQNSAVLRMLEEEENRRGGRAGAKRVAWPPPQEGVLDPADIVEHNAVQVQGGPQSYNQTPGLQQNNFSPQRAAPYQQPAQPSYRPLKPLDVSPVGIGSPLASPALNQSPQAYRPATPTKGWASVQSPVSTPGSQKYFGAPAQGYQSQPQYQPVSQPYQQPNQGFGQPAQQQPPASQSYQQSKTASYAWQEPGRQYTLKQQHSSVQQSQQYQTSSQQYQQPPQQYQQPPQQYQQPPQQYQQPSQQYQQPSQQPPQQYQQPSQQYQPPSQQYQPPSQQYQPPSQQSPQQYKQPSQQYQQPGQQYQQPGQQYLLLSEQYQSPQPQSQPAVPQYQSQSYAQPSTPQNQAPSRPVAAQAQAAPRAQPAKHVEPPPSTITLRKEAPVSQAPAPVYNAQPATATLKGGKHLRGDLKWPPENVRERMAADKAHLEELSKGPANRPPRNEKDYTRFFEAHALNDTYPGYKIPPGTQFFRPI